MPLFYNLTDDQLLTVIRLLQHTDVKLTAGFILSDRVSPRELISLFVRRAVPQDKTEVVSSPIIPAGLHLGKVVVSRSSVGEFLVQVINGGFFNADGISLSFKNVKVSRMAILDGRAYGHIYPDSLHIDGSCLFIEGQTLPETEDYRKYFAATDDTLAEGRFRYPSLYTMTDKIIGVGIKAAQYVGVLYCVIDIPFMLSVDYNSDQFTVNVKFPSKFGRYGIEVDYQRYRKNPHDDGENISLKHQFSAELDQGTSLRKYVVEIPDGFRASKITGFVAGIPLAEERNDKPVVESVSLATLSEQGLSGGSNGTQQFDVLGIISDQELRLRCLDIIEAGGYYDRVVREACVILEDRVRSAAQREKTLIGTNLMDLAFSSKNPILKLSDVEAEQIGALNIFKGVMGFFRNDAGHRLVKEVSRDDAIRFVAMIDLLLRIIDKAEKLS